MKIKYFLTAFLLTVSIAYAGLETGVEYIDDLNINNPVYNDPRGEGDDHIRLIKKAVKQSFSAITGEVTATQDELNLLDGVTSTTAELNILDGVTADAGEINTLDGVTAGTVTASKALIVDANKDISTINAMTVSDLTATLLNASSVLADGVTATTQSADDNSTKVSTTAYVDSAVPEVYISSWYSISQSSLVSGSALTHGLSGAPQVVQHQIKCIDAGGEEGYSQNDIVFVDQYGLTGKGLSVTVDDTNLTIRYSSDATSNFYVHNKSDGSAAQITNSKWEYRVIAVYYP